MTCRLPMFLFLLLLAVAAGGCCSAPPPSARAPTAREVAWATAIRRSYPHWQPPIFPATGDAGERRPATVREAVAPIAGPVTMGETVVEVSLPASPAPFPSVKAGNAVAKPRPIPSKLVVEPEMDDVDFVPAD